MSEGTSLENFIASVEWKSIRIKGYLLEITKQLKDLERDTLRMREEIDRIDRLREANLEVTCIEDTTGSPLQAHQSPPEKE